MGETSPEFLFGNQSVLVRVSAHVGQVTVTTYHRQTVPLPTRQSALTASRSDHQE